MLFMAACVTKVGVFFLESCVLHAVATVLGLAMAMLPMQTLTGEWKVSVILGLVIFETSFLVCCRRSRRSILRRWALDLYLFACLLDRSLACGL